MMPYSMFKLIFFSAYHVVVQTFAFHFLVLCFLDKLRETLTSLFAAYLNHIEENCKEII